MVRRRAPAWILPVLVAFGFILLFLILFRDRLLPAPRFEVVPVKVTRQESAAPEAQSAGSAAGGKVLFQASGWIEADPLPWRATALTDGVIAAVHVLEGQTVEKGDLLATLIDDDARLALEAARENHRKLDAARQTHLASIATARRKHEASCAAASATITLQEEATDQHQRFTRLRGGSIPESEVVSARLRVDRERLLRLAAEAEQNAALAEITRLETENRVRDAEAAAAAIVVKQAELDLERTRIVAPVAGRILRLLAAPGQKKRLDMDDPDSATVAIIYQPEKLQVRVDVPLADAAGLAPGQSARIHCSLLPDRVFRGEVTRTGGEADIQRNTLQAKVRLLDPIPELRPDMLCRVEFTARPAKGGAPQSGGVSLWIPESAVNEGTVWVCDPESKRVRRRQVQIGTGLLDGHRQILAGLLPGEHVVLAARNLRDGQRIRPNPTHP